MTCSQCHDQIASYCEECAFPAVARVIRGEKIRELQQQLSAATQRAETAEARVSELEAEIQRMWGKYKICPLCEAELLAPQPTPTREDSNAGD